MKFVRALSAAFLFGLLALSAGCGGGEEEIPPADEAKLEEAAKAYESGTPASESMHAGGQQQGGR